jgi:hypothetical protein
LPNETGLLSSLRGGPGNRIPNALQQPQDRLDKQLVQQGSQWMIHEVASNLTSPALPNAASATNKPTYACSMAADWVRLSLRICSAVNRHPQMPQRQ